MKPIFEAFEASFLFDEDGFNRLRQMSDDEIYMHATVSSTSSLISFLKEVQRWDVDGVNQCFHVLCDRLDVDYDAYPDYDSLFNVLNKAIVNQLCTPYYRTVINTVLSDDHTSSVHVVYYDTDSVKAID